VQAQPNRSKHQQAAAVTADFNAVLKYQSLVKPPLSSGHASTQAGQGLRTLLLLLNHYNSAHVWVPDHSRVLVVPVACAAHIGLHHTDACLRCCNTLHKAASAHTQQSTQQQEKAVKTRTFC
jgi:hypothetical protein